ncbi:MAG: DoxX family protein [Pseudomonadota bacterium]|nr:DoxX family protein [Pseudomonadota bacterium]
MSVVSAFSRLNRSINLLTPVFDLGVRLWVAYVFFKSGLSKLQSWDSTLMLFEYEYEVPLLPPDIAAYLGTGAELGLPVLLALGVAGRLSALALFLFNIVAVISYSSFLFGQDGAAGLQQHILWGTMMLVTVFHGPGKLSVDHLVQWKLQQSERAAG